MQTNLIARNTSPDLAAGRESDERVACRVFAYSPAEGGKYWVDRRGHYVCGTLPQFSVDLIAAWQVVEAMRAREFNFALDALAGLQWVAAFETEEIRECRSAADTAPLAICRAAVAALEVFR